MTLAIGGEGSKIGPNWSKLPMNSTKKLPTWEKLPASFMDGP